MKPVYVAFATVKLEALYDALPRKHKAERELHAEITKAIAILKQNPVCGTKISKKLWPRKYVKEFSVTNLWKLDLAHGWRLIYTIKTDEVMILNVILEWFDHKGYERRFGY